MNRPVVLFDMLLAEGRGRIGAVLHQRNHFMPVAQLAIPQAHVPLVVSIDTKTVFDSVQLKHFRCNVNDLWHTASLSNGLVRKRRPFTIEQQVRIAAVGITGFYLPLLARSDEIGKLRPVWRPLGLRGILGFVRDLHGIRAVDPNGHDLHAAKALGGKREARDIFGEHRGRDEQQ
jgi:hypothetical protein